MSLRCWFGIHDWAVVSHWNRSLWCEIGRECRRCGTRRQDIGDHWRDRHEDYEWGRTP